MSSTPAGSDGAPLPSLPLIPTADGLKQLDDADLTALSESLLLAEREVAALMAPYQNHLREMNARKSAIATEQRRRERAARHAARVSVRERAGSGDMPTLVDVLSDVSASHADYSLNDMKAFLKTGGEVRFGYATRPGTIAFTDGREQRQATTLREARQLYADGWEPGTPTVAGVRVHLVGTRVERVASVDDVAISIDVK